MSRTLSDKQNSAFERWLRTGRLPPASFSDGVELKFNPWHDPRDGRFTFAEAGHYHGAGGTAARYRAPRQGARDHDRKPEVAHRPRTEPSRGAPPRRFEEEAGGREAAGLRPKAPDPSRRLHQSNSAAEFIGGVGEGVFGVAKEAAATARSVLTTNPATTVRNVGRGIASTIDAAIAAEDTPAAVQVSRAIDTIATASAREIGRATGAVVGNATLAAVPVQRSARLRRCVVFARPRLVPHTIRLRSAG